MASSPQQPGKPFAAKAVARDARRVVDRLPHSLDVATDEAQWLLTLLSADDLRYIFEGTRHARTARVERALGSVGIHRELMTAAVR